MFDQDKKYTTFILSFSNKETYTLALEDLFLKAEAYFKYNNISFNGFGVLSRALTGQEENFLNALPSQKEKDIIDNLLRNNFHEIRDVLDKEMQKQYKKIDINKIEVTHNIIYSF